MADNLCYSVYPSRASFTASNTISLAAANIFVNLLNILTNCFLICALIKTRQTKKISSQFILCLSISDCCVGLILQPMVILLLTYFVKDRNCALEMTAEFLSYVFPQISGVMIMIVALDRFLHMKHLNQYSLYMTRKRGSLLVVTNVVVALCIASCSLVASLYGKFFIFNAILVGVDASVVIAIYVFYTITYRTIHRHLDQMREEQLQINILSPHITKNIPKHDLELAKTMVFILTALSICYLPYFILGLIWSYYHHYKEAQAIPTLNILVWWSFILVYLNSSLNAIIFSARNKRISLLLRKVLCRRKGANYDQPITDIRSSSDV